MRLRANPAEGLRGRATVPGDKSLSHRALLLAGLTVGETRVRGLLEGDDVRATAEALTRLGVAVERADDGIWRIAGVGVGGLAEPDGVLDLGNSGTGARLLLGVLAGHPFTSFVTGDRSLCGRPMARVVDPLTRMGARFLTRSGDRLPLAITGTTGLVPIEFEQPVASAQVKSAILLAGLHTAGRTTVVEPERSRDHTERMLAHLGAAIEVTPQSDGGRRVTIVGQPELTAVDLDIPADPSSAAFLLVAAAAAGGELTLEGVGVNPLRIGLLECLDEMGAGLRRRARPALCGEPVADLSIAAGTLRGIDVPAARAPSMIDEFPILAIAAACATGTTRMTGLAELRVKESDRLAAVAEGLGACGIAAEVEDDQLIVHGCGGRPPGGGTIAARHDHRIAMSFLVLGTLAEAPVTVDGAETIETSFPGFVDLMNHLGADIEMVAP